MKQKHTITAKCFDKKGNLLSQATNSYVKTHPLQAYFASKVGHKENDASFKEKIYLHAEIWAIIKAGDKPIHRIEVERKGKSGQNLNAKPCPICMEAIKAFGIKQLAFTLEI